MREAGLPLLFEPSVHVFHIHTLGASKLLRAKMYHGRLLRLATIATMAAWNASLLAH